MDHSDKEGKSALFAAASMGHLDIVNVLLFWGCYADGIDCEGRTVLSVAAAEGSPGVVQVRNNHGIFRDRKGLKIILEWGLVSIVDQTRTQSSINRSTLN